MYKYVLDLALELKEKDQQRDLEMKEIADILEKLMADFEKTLDSLVVLYSVVGVLLLEKSLLEEDDIKKCKCGKEKVK